MEPLFNDLLLIKSGNVENFEPTYRYDLNDLLTKYNIPAEGDSETCCQKLVESFLASRKRGMTVVPKQSVKCFKLLPQTIYSSDQFRDLVVYVFNKIILIIEVHSCKKKSFINSIKKTILGTIDVIRYYKGIVPSITKCIGFTYPKCGTAECVVEVTVEFKNLKFSYDLQCIPQLEVKEATLRAINANHQHFKPCFDVPIKEDRRRSFVNLSQHELHLFKHFVDSGPLTHKYNEQILQFESKEALLISYNGRMWKYPARAMDRQRLRSVPGDLPFLINVKRYCPSIRGDTGYFTGRGWFYYDKVQNEPLLPYEARKCMGDFVTQLCDALDILHSLDYAHLDVRLENVCFQDDGTLILIDLDRCTLVDDFGPQHISEESCLYLPFNADIDCQAMSNDWLQVGFLLLWVYTSEIQQKLKKDYHNQLLTVDHPIVKEDFFRALIQGKRLLFFITVCNFCCHFVGMFDAQLLKKFVDKDLGITVQHVLQNRKM